MFFRELRAHWFLWSLALLIHLGLWMLYVSKADVGELIAGVGAAMLATIGAILFAAHSHVQFRPSFSMVAEAWRIPWYMLSGTVEILHGLLRQLSQAHGAPSWLLAVPFDPDGDDPRSAGRRALAITYTTVTPNFIVIGIIEEQGLLLYHQILAGEVLQLTKNLGAKP